MGSITCGPSPAADQLQVRKAVVNMSYFSSYCSEVQDYLKACEHLLAAAQNHQQFSEEELQMVESYAMDVAKMHTSSADAKRSVVSEPLTGSV
jgi:hypothetical protein